MISMGKKNSWDGLLHAVSSLRKNDGEGRRGEGIMVQGEKIMRAFLYPVEYAQ